MNATKLKEIAECYNVSVSVNLYHNYACINYFKKLLPSGEWESGWDGGHVTESEGRWSADDDRIGDSLFGEYESIIEKFLRELDFDALIDRKGSDDYDLICMGEREGITLSATLDWSPKCY